MANRITTLIEFQTQTAQASLKKFSTDIKNAEGVSGKFKAGLGGIGDLAKQNFAALAAAAGTAVVAGYKLAKMAADTQANFSALNQVVGETTAQRIDQWADTAAEKVGLSRNAVFEAATTFGMFGKEAGLAGMELESFIQQQITLAADFAAFKNTTPELVIQDIRAAYAGSSETLQKYIGTVNDAAIKQAYFDKTGEKVTGTLTGQQRVIGINALMLEKGADMMGQFSRESGEMAGQQAILEARLRNMADTLGTQLMPAFVELGEVAVEITEDIESVDKAIRELTGGATGLADVMRSTVRVSFGGVATMANELNKAVVGTGRNILGMGDDAEATAAQVDRLAKAQQVATAGTGGAGLAAQELRARQEELVDSTEELRHYYGELYQEYKRNNRAVEDNVRSQDLASRAAEEHKRKVDAVTRAYDNLNDELSDRSAYLDVQDAFDALGDTSGKTMRDIERDQIAAKNAVLAYAEELGNVPPQVATDILALMDQGLYDEALAKLAELERTRTARINIVTSGGSGGVNNRAFAKGTPSAPPGIALVGEEGPELVEFKGGERVHTAAQTRSMLSSGTPVSAGGGGITLNIYAGFGTDGHQLARVVVEALRSYKRGGGSVSF